MVDNTLLKQESNLAKPVLLPSLIIQSENGVYVPAMFVFGDSFGDAGTDNYIPHCKACANFIPYGVSFFPYPTGRFTNGRTTFDFLATCMGLPFSSPYLEPKANFSRGVNFASGGSGLLDSTAADKNVKVIYDVAIKVVIQQPKHKKHKENQKTCIFCKALILWVS